MMKIGELSERTGLAASRIRFYERMGLLQVVERQTNGYRAYPSEAVQILNLIKSAQNAGFSLEELRQLLPPDLGHWEHGALVEALREKIESIDQLQKRLAQSKATIQMILKQVEAKPDDMSCEANARRVLSTLGLEDAKADRIKKGKVANKKKKA